MRQEQRSVTSYSTNKWCKPETKHVLILVAGKQECGLYARKYICIVPILACEKYVRFQNYAINFYEATAYLWVSISNEISRPPHEDKSGGKHGSSPTEHSPKTEFEVKFKTLFFQVRPNFCSLPFQATKQEKSHHKN